MAASQGVRGRLAESESRELGQDSEPGRLRFRRRQEAVAGGARDALGDAGDEEARQMELLPCRGRDRVHVPGPHDLEDRRPIVLRRPLDREMGPPSWLSGVPAEWVEERTANGIECHGQAPPLQAGSPSRGRRRRGTVRPCAGRSPAHRGGDPAPLGRRSMLHMRPVPPRISRDVASSRPIRCREGISRRGAGEI